MEISSLTPTYQWLAENNALDGVFFMETGFYDHDDAWVLHRDGSDGKLPKRTTRYVLRNWLRNVLQDESD